MMTKKQKALRDAAAKEILFEGMEEQYDSDRYSLTEAFALGSDYEYERAKILEKALEAWLTWEAEQIKKDGPYEGKAINELINSARAALAEWRGKDD